MEKSCCPKFDEVGHKASITLDAFWQAAAHYVRMKDPREKRTAGPAEMEVGLSYRELQELDEARLRDIEHLVVHKGMIKEVPETALAAFIGRSEIGFSNEVFVVLDKTERSKSFGPAEWSFYAALWRALSAPAQSVASGRGRFQPLYIGGSTIMAQTWWGDLIYLEATDLSLTPHIAREGYWEHWIEVEFRRMLAPRMTVVDIGANCGYYTLAACREVGTSGQVVAIDANPRMTQLVTMSIAPNGYSERARVVTAAVSDRRGVVEMRVPRRLRGSGSFVATFGAEEEVDVFEAKCGPLTDFVSDAAKIDMLKIDAEGAEPYIWDGAHDVLTRNADILVFMEFAPAGLGAARDPREFLGQIRSLGFTPVEIAAGSGMTSVSDDELLSRSWTEIALARNPSRLQAKA